MKLLVTGGAGFIGSNFIRHVLTEHADDRIVNLDKLTYAGNPANLADVERHPRYSFVHGDICDAKLVRDVARGVDAVVNFAAMTHVDRSILDPDEFLRTDVLGVHVLLEAVRELGIARLLHISTDEVYGSITRGAATETSPLRPTNPYSAQGQRRPPGPGVLEHAQGPHRHHAVLQQLRPLPVPGKSRPAVRDQRAGGPAAADVR